MTARQKPGVFALEGAWDEDLRRGGSVRPLLDLLEAQEYLQFVHRDVGTTIELKYYAEKFAQGRYKSFKILLLAFHGTGGGLQVGDESVDLDELSELLGGSCRGRVVHFSSCSTMRVSVDRLASFKERTGAAAVSGYVRDVGWIESCAFEILLLGALTEYQSRPAALKHVQRVASGLAERLGWQHV